MPEIFASSGAFADNRLERILDTARQWEIRRIELSSGIQFHPDLLQTVMAAAGEFTFLVHNYFPTPQDAFLMNLASGSPDIRRRSLELCTEAIALCRMIRAPFYSFHCGFAFDSDGSHLGHASQLDLPRISLNRAMAHFLESLRQLLPVAEANGVELAIENNVLARFGLIDGRNRTCLGADIESLAYIFDEIASDRLHLLLDLGHAKVNAHTLGVDMGEMIDRFRHRILAVHVSDNDGCNDQNRPLTEDSDLVGHLRRLNVPWIVESRHADPAALTRYIRLLERLKPVEDSRPCRNSR